MGFCKVCGAQIQDGVKFCTECGSPVAAAPDIQGSPSMSGTSQQVAQNQNFNSQSSGQQKQPENTADYKNDGWGVSMGDETMVLNEGWKTQMESGKKVGGDSWGQTNGGQSAPRGRKRSAQNNTAQSNTAQTNTTQQTGFDTSKGSQEPAGSASPFGYGSLSGAQGSSPNQFGYGSPSDSQGQTGSNPQTGAQNQFGYGSPQTGAQNQFGYGNASGGQESAQNQFGYGNQTGSQNQFGYGAQPGSQGQFGAGGQGAAQPGGMPQGNAAQPKAPKEKKAGNKKVFLFAGIGVAAVAVIVAVILIVLKFAGSGKDDPNIGVYKGVSCVVESVEVGAENEWIELKSGSKATLHLMDEEFGAKWSLDGEKLTVTQSGDKYEGTLKDGTIIIDFEGMLYTFCKEGTEPAGDKAAETESKEQAASDAGYWTLLRCDSDSEESALSEEDVKGFKELGLDAFMVLNEDGTGAISLFGDSTKLTWESEKIVIEGENFSYTVSDGQLSFDFYGSVMVFVRGEGEAPEIDWSLNESDDIDEGGDIDGGGDNVGSVDGTDYSSDYDGPYAFWYGDWYGWWVVTSGWGAYSEDTGVYDDVCARITVNDDATGTIQLWNADNAAGEYFCSVDVSFGAGTTQDGCMMSESGYYEDANVAHADWIVDPGASIVSDFDQMIWINGTYTSPDNSDNEYSYYIFLRPWGMEWEDVRTADTTDMPFDDMMPAGYDSWYLPLIQNGSRMPDSFY